MKNYLLSYGMLIMFGLLMSATTFGKMSTMVSVDKNATIQQEKTTKKLSLKERIALKQIKKKLKKQSKKKVTGEQGFGIGKVLLGLILTVIGVFGILASLFSLSGIGVIWGVALIIIGLLVMIWGLLDTVF